MLSEKNNDYYYYDIIVVNIVLWHKILCVYIWTMGILLGILIEQKERRFVELKHLNYTLPCYAFDWSF